MPRIGFNLLLWTAAVNRDSARLFQNIKDWGYDGVELPIFDLDEPSFREVGTLLDGLGLGRTAVTVCAAETNPISPDAAIRRAAVDRLKQVLDCCRAAGVETLCGPLHSALGQFSGTTPTADEWKWGQESLLEVADHARDAGVMLAIEYLNRFECYFLNSARECARFVREANHPSLRMMYDTFHAHIEEKNAVAAIDSCLEYVVHVHISENDRSTPGSGAVAWGPTFEALKRGAYDGWLTIEAFGLALPELAAATKIWRRMYDSEEQLAQDGLKFIKSNWEKATA